MQGRVHKWWMITVLVAMLASASFSLAGCGAKKKTAEELKPRLKVSTVRLDVYPQISKKKSDGEFIVVTVAVTNEDKQDRSMKGDYFTLRNITEKPEEQFEQKPVKDLGFHFRREFGQEAEEKLIGTKDVVVRPQLPVERYLVFELPKGAILQNYELHFKPKASALEGLGKDYSQDEITVPLMTADTEIQSSAGR
ncbi:MAG: hypothetical protein SFZ03_02175 [Candidatus Melainabacteria bacterium]|nr:hypothetical protein [Candidatus Melainabacteria bacterium]